MHRKRARTLLILVSCFFQKTSIGREFNLPPPEEGQWPSLFSLIITPEEELRNQRRQLIVLANNRINLVVFLILLRFYYKQDHAIDNR